MSFHRPLIMGVLNVTPDSFSDGGQHNTLETAIDHARVLAIGGADIIDVGGESTRPGAERVPVQEEIARVVPIIRAIKAELSVQVSIDTMNALTARAAVEAGADIINDVSGGLADSEIFRVAAESGATIVISHWRGHALGAGSQNEYEDIAKDVVAELKIQVDKAISAGVHRDKIVIDPGLGFAKDLKQNWELVARLDELESLGLPILVGASRKRFIAGVIAPEDPSEADNGRRDLATAVLTALLLQRKLWGVRVHNVVATEDAISIVSALHQAKEA
jgi:dihydropteroate synthase